MTDSVFTKIIKNEIPADRVYEDDKTIAIIPLYPIAKAHVLVIPKTQVVDFMDLSDEDYRALMDTVKKIAKHLRSVVGAKRVGLHIEGLEVPHAHVHVLAFDTPEEFRQIADTSKAPDLEKNASLAKKLAL